VHRADTLTGPYEGRVALQDQGVAQGGLLETADGRWYAFLFKDHGAVGRVPHLVPVEWRDGWPVLGTEGRVPELLDLPPRREPFGNLVTSDGFAREAGAAPFPLAWQWNHNPDDRFWSLSERPGYLRLTAGRIDASLTEARNVLTQRTFGPVCSAHVALDVSGLKPGDVAGLAAFQKRYGFVGVKQGDGVRSLVVMTAEDGDPAERAVLPLEASVVHLRIDCDFRDPRDVATFHVSLDGERWEQLGGPLQMTYTLPHFMGYRFGLFHFATRETGGRADFDFYQLSPSRRD
jgi:beta-xylosidase